MRREKHYQDGSASVAVKSQIVWTVGWGYSDRCNMKCPYCYSRKARSVSSSIIEQKLSSAIAFALSNAKHIKSINWGTGENSLEKEWWHLVKELRLVAPDILQGVTTNGYLGALCTEDDEYLNIFVDCIDDLDVSLDFADESRHNALRGHPMAYDWAVETLRLCNEHGKPCSLVMVGSDESLCEVNIDEVFSFAKNYGCNVRINILRPTPGVSAVPPSYKTIKQALIYIVDQYAVISLADPLFAALFGEVASDESGTSSLRILPDGSITPSTYLTEKPWIACGIYDFQMPKLKDVGQQLPFSRISDSSLPVACERCPKAHSCKGGAKDRRILWYGDLSERDPYCPTRHDGDLGWGEISSDGWGMKKGPLIHDGYLPTLIFNSKRIK